ncbi:unnamed protein product [Pseudo-nitzschia multistriata]|uniref:Cryptochrome/DNA photolyase FAD-binding domain-containing protein n=1 Tax=Pseudo-nitzschia multistriata TaxID=183589 RepID=A0A448ZEC9_9STRA|nr:unnamed protein product [Pseudo-nitzschia multistriata]
MGGDSAVARDCFPKTTHWCYVLLVVAVAAAVTPAFSLALPPPLRKNDCCGFHPRRQRTAQTRTTRMQRQMLKRDAETPSLVRRKRRLVWHRNRDLRFHDHPFYGGGDRGVPTTSVFVFDEPAPVAGKGGAIGSDPFVPTRPSTCLPGDWGTVPNLGPHGMRVLLESVEDLRRQSFLPKRPQGQSQSQPQPEQPLVVRRGPTVPVLMGLLEELVTLDESNESSECEYEYEVCWNEEPGWHELELSGAVRDAILDRYGKGGCEPSSYGGKTHKRKQVVVTLRTALSCTLYHPDDLPGAGSWTPMSKKEKRRLENQRKRQKQLLRRGGGGKDPPGSLPSEGLPGAAKAPRTTGPHDLVDLSVERWSGMPRIMGDFRRIARERAGVRACDSHSSDALGAARDAVLHGADTDARVRSGDAATKEPPEAAGGGIDPGPMPTLESLLEPLLLYVGDGEDYDHGKKPILGLPPAVIREACYNSIRIHQKNRGESPAGRGSPAEAGVANTTTTMIGGETAALKHLSDFCNHHLHRAERSLACVDDHQSSHLGQYLAFGCLSPRTVVGVADAAIAKRRQAQGGNDGGEPHPGSGETRKNHNKNNDSDNASRVRGHNARENDGTWLVSHMTMRDFFLYTCLASGKKFYRLEGIPISQKQAAAMEWKPFFPEPQTRTPTPHGHKRGSTPLPPSPTRSGKEPSEALDLWRAWATGTTGLPLVDAGMRELLATGYTSNRVRQNAASVLAKDLALDWRAGAEWFQFLLADHCVAANWGNWLYFSGVGPDPKQRHFCTVSQALKYDPSGAYVRKWLPSLRDPPEREEGREGVREGVRHPDFHLRPWDFDGSWPTPIVDPDSQYTWRELERLKTTGRLTE